MNKVVRRSLKKPGTSPGTLIHIGERKVDTATIRFIEYDETQFHEKDLIPIEECLPLKPGSTIAWINIDGLHDVDLVDTSGKHFELHPLLLEDVMNTGQRSKTEDYDGYIFIVLKMLRYDEQKHRVMVDQVSLVLGRHFVLSFQEGRNHLFDPVLKRIRENKGKIRKMGADYLAYALLDAVVDHYFVVLEHIGERIEVLEDELLENPSAATMEQIHRLKRELIFVRKSVWPLREVVGELERGESSLIQKTTEIFLRDVYDHTIQVIDTVETYRDMTAGMLDMYLTGLSNKMNEVMKVLTMIATIFIPLSFIASIYGMNFENMPELTWRWGYPGLWLIIITIAGGMILYFRKKEWL